MSVVRIENVGVGSLDHATKLLAGIEGGISKAAKNAMSRAVAYLRTNSTRAIRQKYDITAANIRAERNIEVKYRYGSGVCADVLFAGEKIPLFRYGKASPKQPGQSDKIVNAIINGNWRKVHPSLPAAGHQLKGTAAVHFKNAFVAQMKSGHIGIFERTGGSSAKGGDAIRQLMGSSVPQMLGNKEVEEHLVHGALGKFDERLNHEVTQILNGWGR